VLGRKYVILQTIKQDLEGLMILKVLKFIWLVFWRWFLFYMIGSIILVVIGFASESNSLVNSNTAYYINLMISIILSIWWTYNSMKESSSDTNYRSSGYSNISKSSSEIQSMIDSVDYSNHPKDSIGYRYNKRKNK